jgi:hypothetical protein
LDFEFQASLRQTKTCQERNFPSKLKKIYKPLLFFFPQIGTGVYHWNPPTKQESMQWVHKVRFPPKKAKTQSSGGKRMATIFWAEEGLLKDGKRYYNQWRGLFEDNLKVKRSIEIETAFIVASKKSVSF